jgi:hypothetical protein
MVVRVVSSAESPVNRPVFSMRSSAGGRANGSKILVRSNLVGAVAAVSATYAWGWRQGTVEPFQKCGILQLSAGAMIHPGHRAGAYCVVVLLISLGN